MKRQLLEILTREVTCDEYFWAVGSEFVLIGRYDAEPCVIKRSTFNKLLMLVPEGMIFVRDGVLVLTRKSGVESSYMSILCSPTLRIQKNVTTNFYPEKYNCHIF